MAKQLEKTPEIEAEIRASVDDDTLDVSTFAVFEARMLSTEAINQKGFHNGARVSRSTLVEMAEFVNSRGTTTSLQTMHNNEMLPVGRVFNGSIKEIDNGETELRGMFYIAPVGELEKGLIAKIEASVIDEVSVGLLSKKALCSECGFDYLGSESDFFNLMTMTCEEGHTIGEDGVHLRLVGMDTFAELSLVGRGAAKDAKIFSRAKSSLGEKSVERLAASGVPVAAHVLTASYKMDNKPNATLKGETNMGLETLLAEKSQELGTTTLELSQAVKSIEGLNGEIVSLKASAEEKDAKIVALEAAKDTDVAELTAAKVALEDQVTQAKEFVLADLKAALVASGEKADDVPEDLIAMFALIKEKGLKLHQMFGSTPVSSGTPTDVKTEVSAKRRKSNFQING